MTSDTAPPNGERFLCVASVLRLRRWRDILPFLRLTRRVARQADASPGLVRYALKANIPRRRFYTFTVWEDRASMNAFVRAEPHATAVRMAAAWVAEGTAFTEWESAEVRVDWAEVRRRLDEAPRRYQPPSR